MGKSQRNQDEIIRLGRVAIVFILASADLALAGPRPCVSVELDVERHVNPSRLKLTYHIPPTCRDESVTISIATGPVQEGAGLVVEHIAADGAKSVQSLPPEPLYATFRQNPELALASCKFKNPPSAREMPTYRRNIAEEIDEAIEKGSRQDEVLLLLGSPQSVGYATISEKKAYDRWDESWHYETSPVGGYAVMFKDGRVVKTMYYTDSSDP